ncbi:MAG: T9SS type A sorting domain-containing protein [Bacteroidales bacterium]|nr:T9SS type A sorting domain-containing protein [Bacteroidales bacterium]MCF8457427.1 T9SS type A sorting domain-containing protein [Bacteroidales bacterium]
MKNLFIISLFFLISMPTRAQITFQQTYGGTGVEVGISVQQTTDGGYMLFGSTTSFGNGGSDMYLIKTDEFGNQQWGQTFGGPASDFGVSARQTTDGGYILCGSYSGMVNDSLALIKTDSNGVEIWNKRYSGSVERDVGQFVQQTSDGGFIAVGFTGTGFEENIYMLKIDLDGNEQWSKVIGSTGREYAECVRQTNDGGYIMFGETNSKGHGGKDMYLLKTNNMGDTLWTKTYGTSLDEIGRSLWITSDNGFILLGYEDFDGGNLFLVKTDSLGNEQWGNYYGGSGWDVGHAVQQTSDGGFILAGSKQDSIDINEMYCIKTDDTGTVLWENTYPKGLLSVAHSVEQTTDGGYVLLGYFNHPDYGYGYPDMYLVKIDEMGSAFVFDNDFHSVNVSTYPNPFAESFTIKWHDPANREFGVTLSDCQGQTVRFIHNIKEREARFERGNLASGMYFYQLTSNKQVVAAGKVIVQ